MPTSFIYHPSTDADPAAALDFLTNWSPPPWVLIAIEPKRSEDHRPRFDFLDTRNPAPPEAMPTASVTAFLIRNHERSWNIYYTPYLPIPDLRTSPRKNPLEIQQIRSIHVDLDLPHPPHPRSAPILDNFNHLYERLLQMSPPPTVIIFSGGGFQALWRLLLPIDDPPANAAHIEEINVAIERSLGGDNCHNVNRILRLPGTVNFPDYRKLARGRTPQTAYVATASWDLTWSLDAPPPTPLNPVEADTLDPEPEHVRPTAAAFTFADLSPRLQKIVRGGDPAPWEHDRSKMVWYVITNLIRRGWPDETILPFLLDPVYALSNHVRAQGDPRAYALRQLTRARGAVAEDWERDLLGRLNPRSQTNVRRALDELGARFSFDTFALKAYVNGYGPLRRLDDDTAIDLRLAVDRQFRFLADKDLFHDVTRHLCRTGDFHPVRSYLDTLVWDLVPRLGYPATPDLPPHLVPLTPTPGTVGWLTTYGGAEDSAYVRMVGRLTLLAAVRRIKSPGAKFDELLVLVNPQQGTDKSTALHVLAKNIEWFSDNLPFGATPKVIIERLAGKWIVEASDLTGMRRADIDEMKQFLSAQVDEDRLAYDRYRTELPRQWVAIGTTNSEVFLTDTQNRRFWPVRVRRFDIAALARDVDQLWAEATYAEAQGESIRLPEHYWSAAADVQDAARSHEPWVEEIAETLRGLNGKILNADVWKIIDMPLHQRTQLVNRRLGEAMRELGFERMRARVDGHVSIVYVRGTEDERQHTIYVFRDPVRRGPAVASMNTNPFDDATPDPATQLPV